MTTGQQQLVLIVDDEEPVRDLLKRIVEGAGYGVVIANDGYQAMGKMLELQAQVVLLDINMPGASGLDVLQQISDNWPDTCVIMVTAVDDTETAIEAMKMGAYDYITKPFNQDDVILRVNKAIEKSDLRLRDLQYKLELQRRFGDQIIRLRDQFKDLVDTLARQHNLLRQTSSKSLFSKLPKAFQKPMSGVEEYRDAVIRMLRREE